MTLKVVTCQQTSQHLPGQVVLRLEPDANGRGLGHRDSGAYTTAKRLIDIIIASLLLAICFPLMLVLAVLVMATSPGPALFRQVRLGQHGVRFAVYKFRTMARDAERQLEVQPGLREAFEASYKLANDPRVTRLGAFLRRSSLDELPQLLNVLRGEMSLIGPRPIVPPEIEKYGPWGAKLLTVKPGLGGQWQAHGRSETTYDERIALDMDYIDGRSLGRDLALIAGTALAVFRRRGSC